MTAASSGPFEVGKVYRVPTVLATWFDRFRYWPVAGPLHDDAEILNFPRRHSHIDRRFVSDEDAGLAINYPLVNFEGGNPGRIVMRRRVCRRSDTSLAALQKFSSYAKWQELEAHYARARMKGMRCPHRGADLSRECVHGGIVTCPLHGLSWRIDGGELVSAEDALAAHDASARAA